MKYKKVKLTEHDKEQIKQLIAFKEEWKKAKKEGRLYDNRVILPRERND